jgi:hypothetical protein
VMKMIPLLDKEGLGVVGFWPDSLFS